MATEANGTEQLGVGAAPERAMATSRALWWLLAAIAGVKIVLLFIALPLFQRASPADYQIGLFPDRYDAIALNVLEGRGYRLYEDTSETMLRTPGFVLILAGIFAVTGKSLVAVQAFQLALSLVAGWALYRLTLRATASQKAAIVATAIFLLYPGTILAESRGGVETTYTACAVLFLFLFYKAIETFAYGDFVLAGVAFGLAFLIRSTLALALPGLFIYMAFFRRQPGPAFWRLVALFAAASLAALVVVSPWIIRNYRISGDVVPTMNIGSLSAFQALWVEKHRGEGKPHWQLLSDVVPEQTRIAREMGLRVRSGFFPAFYSVQDENRYYNELARRVRMELMASPSLALGFVAHNFLGFWIQGRTPKATAANAILIVPFLMVALAGAIMSVGRKLDVMPVVVFVVAFLLPHLPIHGVARFHTPLVPFLAIFVAVGLVSLWDQLTATRRDAGARDCPVWTYLGGFKR